MPQPPPLQLNQLTLPDEQSARVDTLTYARRSGELANLLLSEDSLATPIFIWACSVFDPSWLDPKDPWDVATVRMELADHLGVDRGKVPHDAVNRLMAARDIVTTNRFYESVHAFVALTNVLAGDTPDADLSSVTPEECAWAVTEARFLHPPDSGYGFEVKSFLRHLLEHEGYQITPRSMMQAVGDLNTNMPGSSALTLVRHVDQKVQQLLLDLRAQLEKLPLRDVSIEPVLEKVKTAILGLQ